MNTAADLLKALRINAEVISEDEGTVKLSLTATQYGHLSKVLDRKPAIENVDGNRLHVSVEGAELMTAVESGKSAYQVTNVEYQVQLTYLYEIRVGEDENPANDVTTMTWLPDAQYGTIIVNDESYPIESATSDELFDDPANPDRKQLYIDAIVDESSEEIRLMSGSPSGLIKRVVNYGKRIRKS